MPESSDLHLQVALEANAAAYRRTVQTSTPGECWDVLVLTAANEKQAEGYRRELELRRRSAGPAGALFPAIQKSIVVADPPGRRAGSGGATLAAVRAVAGGGMGLEELQQLRILVIHSGGASQRLPAYSAQGKIFSPLPLLRPDGQISTLFDHLFVTLAGLPERLGPGMLVVAGDVFLLFDHRHVRHPLPGVTALTLRVEPELALGHGIYVVQREQRIRRTLQKAPIAVMREWGATDEHGRVLIDTGLLFFDAERVRLLGELAGLRDGKPHHGRGCRRAGTACPCRQPGLQQTNACQIDLYSDITAALAADTALSAYLGGGAGHVRSTDFQAAGENHGQDAHATAARHVRAKLWGALHGTPFQAMVLEGEFLHLGTTRQFRDAMVGRDSSAAAGLFQQDLLTHGSWPAPAQPAGTRAHGSAKRIASRIYHSVLVCSAGAAQPRRSTEIGAGSVIDHSILAASSRIGTGSVVSQAFSARPLVLGGEMLFFQVPIAASARRPRCYVQVLCGIEDDFKGCYDEGKCVFLNHPIEEWFVRHGIQAEAVWPGVKSEARTLWNARLFPATVSRDEAAAVLWLAAGKSAPARVAAWRKSARFSMAMILEQVDPLALIEHREIVSAYLQAGTLRNAIHSDQALTVDSTVGHFTSQAAYEAAERLLTGPYNDDLPPSTPRPALSPEWKGNAEVWKLLCQARATWCAAQLRQRPGHPAPGNGRVAEALMERAFAVVAKAAEAGYGPADGGAPISPQHGLRKLEPGLEIEATAPVRLDLGGGWSDTPPYCFERGGHVINVAIDLNGRPPVAVRVQTTPELELLAESQDLGRRAALSKSRFDRSRPDLNDPFSLHMVALDMCGLLPRNSAAVASFCRELGAGLRISTECRVPKGSGLGTSSILAATLLAALHALRGGRPSRERLLEETLILEQRLSSGGGWQDQAGGIFGGVKSTTTVPGIPQRPRVETLALAPEILDGLEQRLVVYYSGQQRLARDILRRVMGRWLAREPAVLFLMDELKESAAGLRQALLSGKWLPLGHEIARYWRIKKELYPGSTTPAADVLFAQLRDQCLAAGFAGAGGGGFAYFLCKDPSRAERLRKLLAAQAGQPGKLGSVFETQINRQGLRLKVRPRTPVGGP